MHFYEMNIYIILEWWLLKMWIKKTIIKIGFIDDKKILIMWNTYNVLKIFRPKKLNSFKS